MKLGEPLAILAAVPLLSQCTIVTVHGDDVRTESHFGTLRLIPGDGAMIAYSVKGVGLVPGYGGATLGYAREQAVIVPLNSHCRIIIFDMPDDAESNRLWTDLIRQRPDICLIGEDGNEEAVDQN